MSERCLSIVCGNAGVGKTTWARGLATRQRACLLDIDTVSEQLVRAGMRAAKLDPNDRDSPRYKEIFREPIHETLFVVAEQNLDHLSCVVVAPLTQERRDPQFLARIEARVNVGVQVYYLTCREETRRARIVARDNPRDAAKLANWADYSKRSQDSGPPPFSHVLIDTDVSR